MRSGAGRSGKLGRYGIRAVAVLTLVAGVGAALTLDEDRADQQGGINAEQYDQAVLAEQALVKADLAQWKKETAHERELQAAAKARAAAEAREAAARAKAAETEASRRGANRTTDYGPIPASCKVYSGNRAIGCAVLLSSGFKLDQMPCLDKLWTRESHWNARAMNSSSGAYGIPQAVPGDKMGKIADDWRTNPATQIKWGLGYIKGRYGTPCGAWQQSEDAGWY